MQRNGVLNPTVVSRHNPERQRRGAQTDVEREIEFEREFREYLNFARQSLELETRELKISQARKIRE